MSNAPRKDMKELRIKEAAERQKVWDALSIKEKIAALDDLLGAGLGAKKQRARYAAILAEEAKPKPKKGEKVEKAPPNHKGLDIVVPVEMPKEGLSVEQVTALHNRGLPEDLKVKPSKGDKPKKGKKK